MARISLVPKVDVTVDQLERSVDLRIFPYAPPMTQIEEVADADVLMLLESSPKFDVLVVQVLRSVDVKSKPPLPPAIQALFPYLIEFMVVENVVILFQSSATDTVFELENVVPSVDLKIDPDVTPKITVFNKDEARFIALAIIPSIGIMYSNLLLITRCRCLTLLMLLQNTVL